MVSDRRCAFFDCIVVLAVAISLVGLSTTGLLWSWKTRMINSRSKCQVGRRHGCRNCKFLIAEQQLEVKDSRSSNSSKFAFSLHSDSFHVAAVVEMLLSLTRFQCCAFLQQCSLFCLFSIHFDRCCRLAETTGKVLFGAFLVVANDKRGGVVSRRTRWVSEFRFCKFCSITLRLTFSILLLFAGLFHMDWQRCV